jgi:hypothetical protein
MKQILPVTLLGCLAGFGLLAQNIVGDWHGTLKAGGAELRLNLHISGGDKGGLTATIDSVDQGTNGIPVTSTTLDGSTLKLKVDSIQGTYEGKVNADATSIAGTWTQGQAMPLEFQRGNIALVEHKPAKPSDIDGAWSGTLDLGGGKMRIVFHIVNTADGLTATADSPDQGAKGLPVSTVTRNGSSLKLEMKAVAASFEGKISSDLATITGTFMQNGSSVAVALAFTSSTRPRETNL